LKRTIFFVLTLALTLMFCFSRSLDGKNKDRYLAPNLEPGTIKSSTPGNTHNRRENNFRLLRQMQELSSRCSSILSAAGISTSPTAVTCLMPPVQRYFFLDARAGVLRRLSVGFY